MGIQFGVIHLLVLYVIEIGHLRDCREMRRSGLPLALVIAVLARCCSGQTTSLETILWNKLVAATDAIPFNLSLSGGAGSVTLDLGYTSCFSKQPNSSMVVTETNNIKACPARYGGQCYSIYGIMNSCSYNPVYEAETFTVNGSDMISDALGYVNFFQSQIPLVVPFNHNPCGPNGDAHVFIEGITAPNMPTYNLNLITSNNNQLLTNAANQYYFQQCSGLTSQTPQVMFNATISITSATESITGTLEFHYSNFYNWSVMVAISVFRSTMAVNEGIFGAASIAPIGYPTRAAGGFNWIAPVDAATATDPILIPKVVGIDGKVHTVKIYINNITFASAQDFSAESLMHNSS